MDADLLAKAKKWGRDRALYARSLRADKQREMADWYAKPISWREDARSLSPHFSEQEQIMKAAAESFLETLGTPP